MLYIVGKVKMQYFILYACIFLLVLECLMSVRVCVVIRSAFGFSTGSKGERFVPSAWSAMHASSVFGFPPFRFDTAIYD